MLKPDTIRLFWEMLQQVQVSPLDSECEAKLSRLLAARDDMNEHAKAMEASLEKDGF